MYSYYIVTVKVYQNNVLYIAYLFDLKTIWYSMILISKRETFYVKKKYIKTVVAKWRPEINTQTPFHYHWATGSWEFCYHILLIDDDGFDIIVMMHLSISIH